MSERTLLRTRRNDSKGFPGCILLFEFSNQRSVLSNAVLARTKRVIEITDRVRQVIPAAIVVDKVYVRGFSEGIWVLMTSIAFDRKSGTGRRINKFADFAPPAKFNHAERTDDVHV